MFRALSLISICGTCGFIVRLRYANNPQVTPMGVAVDGSSSQFLGGSANNFL
jgi:hypothetical protein